MRSTNEYNSLLRKLGLSQLAAARLLRVANRTGQRYAAGDVTVPWAYEKLLQLLADGRITVEDLED